MESGGSVTAAGGARVAVVGAGGRVGLPMALVLACNGFDVVGIDTDAARVAEVEAGRFPFREEGGEEYLQRALTAGALQMSCEIAAAEGADAIVIIPGTPVDDHLNPRLEPLVAIFEALAPMLRKGQLLVLRSTVAPGTTERLRGLLEARTGMDCASDLHLVFAPERALEGEAIREIQALPQIVGAFSDASFEAAEAFFSGFVTGGCVRMTPVEAELGKLVTNMARYVRFAFANEVAMLAESWGANAFRLIEGVNRDYPRAGIARPGPNVGGPCLYKDGLFLMDHVAFPDLIAPAARINEGMTARIVSRLQAARGVQRVAILGMAFKGDSDDPRESLSFKLRKQLRTAGFEVVSYDPLIAEFADPGGLRGCDAAVLMTPHAQFAELAAVAKLIGNDDCLVVDLWGHWPAPRYESVGGAFRLGDYA